MKKILAMALLLVIFLASTPSAGAAPATYRILVDGHVVTGDTLTRSNTTLVPFRVILQELDYKVSYTARTKTIQADKPGIKVTLTIGSTKAFINGKETKMPVAPVLEKGVTYVPLRFIANVSGEQVELDQGRRAIQIGEQIDWKLLDQPAFRGMKWGATMSQVDRAEKAELYYENTTNPDNPYLKYYYTEFAGLPALATYEFPDKTLQIGGYYVNSSGLDSHLEDYKMLTAYLTKEYGEPVFDILSDEAEELPQYISYDLETLVDEELLFAAWKTVDTNIMLMVQPELNDLSDILIVYSSWRGNKVLFE